jgi:glutathione S-transferase
MILVYTPSSPFARKVCIVAHEKGLFDQLQLVECSSFADLERVQSFNPVGKIPVLVLDDGTALYDSTVICEYLDETGKGERLTPASGMPRWLALRGQALADDMMAIAVGLTMEFRRPEAARSQPAIERSRRQLMKPLAAMEDDLARLPNTLAMTHISYASILGYLDFRHSDLPWRTSHPRLSSWFDAFSERPSMQATKPQNIAPK